MRIQYYDPPGGTTLKWRPKFRRNPLDAPPRASETVGVFRYILKRLLGLLPTTLGVLLLTFVLFHVVGGSPAEVVLGQHANAAALAAFDARHGYDKPLLAGRWFPSRAWHDGAAVPDDAVMRPFYALRAGTWRLEVEAVPQRLTEEPPVWIGDDFRLTPGEPSRAGAWTVTIPPGHSVREIRLPAEFRGRSARLRRRNEHWLDSQLVHYVLGLLRGDLGESTAYGMRVAEVLRQGVGPSLALTLPMLLGGTLLGLMLAMAAAACRGGRVDRGVLFGSTLLMSVNYVVWVLAGQYLLAFKWRLFPIWGYENWTYLLLPVAIGIVSGLGRDVRYFRTVILDEINRPYVRTAIAKGLSHRRVLWRHVLRNSLIPVATYVSLSVPFLFTGSLLLESFFGIPGLGGVSLNAIHSSDMATVRAVVILGALAYQLVNLLTDLAYAWLDPRVRLGETVQA